MHESANEQQTGRSCGVVVKNGHADACRPLLSPAARVLTSIGIGCYLGWQTIDISPTLFPAPLAGVREALDVWGYAATALLLCLLAGFGFLARRRPGMLVECRWLVWISCLGPALGTATLYLSGWVGEEARLGGVVIGRLLFATSAGLVVLWGELLSLCGATHMLACAAGGYALSFGICLIEANLAPEAALLLRPVLPLLSGVALVTLRGEVDGVHETEAAGAWRGGRATANPHAWANLKPFVATGALGAVFIAANHLSETKTTVSTELYTLIAGIFTCLAIACVARLGRGRIGGFSRLYRLITPLVIGCLLLTLVLEPGSQHYEALAIGGAWAFFRVFTWTLWGRIAEHDPRGGAFVFALGQIALTACSTAGELLCAKLDLSTLPLVATASAIIGVTVLVSMFLLEDGDVVKRIETEEDQPNADRVFQESPTENVTALTLADMARLCAGLPLSEREREISLLVLQGNDNATICEVACITESTLRTHLRNIYAKTDAHGRQELVEMLRARMQTHV